MGKVFEAIWAAVFMITVATGSTYAVKKIGAEIKHAAITKAAQGLPPLSPFAKGLTNRSK